MGTLTIKHNEEVKELEECLYDLLYSNIVSGPRVPHNSTTKGKGLDMAVKTRRKVLYKIEQDEQGLWVKVEPLARSATLNGKEIVISLHERYEHVLYNTPHSFLNSKKNIKRRSIMRHVRK